MAKEAKEAKEKKEKKANKPVQKQQRSKKKEEPQVRIKTKEGEYIHHDLYDQNGWVTSCLGDDPTPLFEAVDRYYFEHRKKIALGKLKRGSPFKCYITRRVGLHDCREVLYVPGSTLGNRYRWRDDDDEDEEFDYFGDY